MHSIIFEHLKKDDEDITLIRKVTEKTLNATIKYNFFLKTRGSNLKSLA